MSRGPEDIFSGPRDWSEEGPINEGHGQPDDAVGSGSELGSGDDSADVLRAQRELREERKNLELPDLTQSILSRVEAERPFLNKKTRRAVWIGRSMMAAGVALAVLAGTLLYRYAPESVDVSRTPTPLSTLVHRVENQATQRIGSVQETMTVVSHMGLDHLQSMSNAEPVQMIRMVISMQPGSAGSAQSQVRICLGDECENAGAVWITTSSGGPVNNAGMMSRQLLQQRLQLIEAIQNGPRFPIVQLTHAQGVAANANAASPAVPVRVIHTGVMLGGQPTAAMDHDAELGLSPR